MAAHGRSDNAMVGLPLEGHVLAFLTSSLRRRVSDPFGILRRHGEGDQE